MSAIVITSREFAARRLAMYRASAAGFQSQAGQAQRMAARLFAEGRSADAAARLAVQSIARRGGVA